MNNFFCALRIDGRPISKTELFGQIARLPRGLEWQSTQSGPFFALTPNQRHALRPQIARGRGYVGAGDVRLDNRAELLASCRIDGEGKSDLEVLCEAIDRKGADIIPRVLGDFCLVYWDARAQKIMAARDAFGVKPLFYRREGDYLLIGSRMSALVGDETLDHDYIADLLVGLPSASPRTVWKGTLALEPGALLVQRGSVTAQSRYWDAATFEPASRCSEADAIAEFRRLFFEAVDCRTRTDDPVWAQLSGGLDSSAVVAAAERSAGKLAGTVTVVDSLGDGDETTYSAAVLAKFSLRNETVRDYWPWRNDHGGVPPRTDEPTPLFPFYARDQRLVDIVRHNGARVLLSGLGSDHYLSSNLHYMADLVAAGSVRNAMREALGWAIATRRSFWSTAHHNAVLPLLRQTGLRRRPARLPRFISPRFAGAHAVQQRMADAHTPFARLGRLHITQTAGELRGLTNWMQRGPFEDQLEMRYPFLHRPLVEFALSLPISLKVRPGTHKWILREAMRGVVPEKIRTRTTKGGMDARIFWTLQHEASLVRTLLTDPILGQMGCVDVDELHKMVEVARQGEYRHTVHLFSVLSLETWLRTRFDMWSPHAAQTAA
ncbi:MAG TPA: asparagine synthase-related protein [Longimicrobiales bacterium]